MTSTSRNQPTVSERRHHRRVPLVCDVWQRCGQTEPTPQPMPRLAGLAGRTLNLSDGGALIQLTDLPDGTIGRPQVGQWLDLTVALPRATADTYLLEHVRVHGEVVRVISHGAGQPPTTFAIRFGQSMTLQLD